MGFDAVGWPRLGFRSLRPDLVDQGLPDIGILGSHRATEKKFDIFPKDQFNVHSCYFDESPDPYARLECRSTDRHAVAGDHLASHSIVFATDKNLAHLGIWKVTVVNNLSVVELYECAVRRSWVE